MYHSLVEKPLYSGPVILNVFLGFKDFGACLAKDIKVVEKAIGLIQENKEHLLLRKRRKERERTANIKTSCLLYKSDFRDDELMEYLRSLANITSRNIRYNPVEDDI